MTPLSSSEASLKAADAPPPLLIPAKIPSVLASLRLIAVASASDISIIRSTRFGSNILGKYASGHLRIPGIDESSVG